MKPSKPKVEVNGWTTRRLTWRGSLISAVVFALALVAAFTDGVAAAGAWNIETVDSGGSVGKWTSMAIDPAGSSHISYYDRTNGDLKYARQDGGAWVIEFAKQAGANVGKSTSVALDASGYPHISYCTGGTPTKLMYAYKDASGWHSELVWGGTVDVGEYNSIAVDADGYPHISFYNSQGRLIYAYKDAGGWHFEGVDASVNVGGAWNSLVLDSAGNPHISYKRITCWSKRTYNWTLKRWIYKEWLEHNLAYAYRDGAGWHVEIVDSGNRMGPYDHLIDTTYVEEMEKPRTGSHGSICLDASGLPHISYRGGAALKYAYKDAGGWHVEKADDAATANFTSIKVGGSGRPQISYYDIVNCDLKYATRDASGWLIETVDSIGVVGKYSALALDAGENPRISYYDETNADLKYAWQAP
ncbi:MAG: hypothetical protein AB1500_07020 [Bacillota bacterium]